MVITISIGRYHTWVPKLFTVINPSSMAPITIEGPLIMIKLANIMAEFSINFS